MALVAEQDSSELAVEPDSLEVVDLVEASPTEELVQWVELAPWEVPGASSQELQLRIHSVQEAELAVPVLQVASAPLGQSDPWVEQVLSVLEARHSSAAWEVAVPELSAKVQLAASLQAMTHTQTSPST